MAIEIIEIAITRIAIMQIAPHIVRCSKFCAPIILADSGTPLTYTHVLPARTCTGGIRVRTVERNRGDGEFIILL